MANYKHKELQPSYRSVGGVRKSAAVPLMLAAGALLTGCSKQDEYSSLDACTKDWARSELCKPKQSGSNWVYTGPKYSSDDQRDTMRREAQAHVNQQAVAATATAAAVTAAAYAATRPAAQESQSSGTSVRVSTSSHSGSHDTSVARSGFGDSGHATSSHSGTSHSSGG